MKFRNLLLLNAFVFSVVSFNYAYADNKKMYIEITKPAEGTALIGNTEVSLGELTAVGTVDPKVEWSADAKKYLTQAAKEYLEAKKYKITDSNINDNDSSDALQIIKLNEMVTMAITANSVPMLKMPTKKDFSWTVGEGASKMIPPEMIGENQPKYALFIEVEGSYSSDGRKALMVGALLLGAGIPLGGQDIRATLVDLQTGQVVWFTLDRISFTNDVRTKEGAKSQIEKIFKDLPL